MDDRKMTSLFIRLRDTNPANPTKTVSPDMTGKVPTNSSTPSKTPTDQTDDIHTAGQSSTSPRKISTRTNPRGKMIKKAQATGFEECMKMIEELKDTAEALYVFFLGTKSHRGSSWCPDCVVGEDILETCMDKMETDAVVLYVDVGDRSSWKSLDNVWRKDPKMRLTNIPTIIEWKRRVRLEGEQCLQLDVVQMFLGIE